MMGISVCYQGSRELIFFCWFVFGLGLVWVGDHFGLVLVVTLILQEKCGVTAFGHCFVVGCNGIFRHSR